MGKILISLTSKRAVRFRNNCFSSKSFSRINSIIKGQPSKYFTFFWSQRIPYFRVT
jgi:hypothetical protein